MRAVLRIEELGRRLGKDSHNSSKPPSSDGRKRFMIEKVLETGSKSKENQSNNNYEFTNILYGMKEDERAEYTKEAENIRKMRIDIREVFDGIREFEGLKGNEAEIKILLDRAKPELSHEAVNALEKIKSYLEEEKNRPSDDEYITSVKKALEILNPETWKDYQDLKIGFSVNKKEDFTYPKAKLKEGKEWQFQLPSKCDYSRGIILRSIDAVITAELKGKSTEKITSDPDRRAEIMARAFLTNLKLGEKYGWSTQGYPLAEQYHRDYEIGICEAFRDGSINAHTSKEELIQIGHTFARQKLIDLARPDKHDLPIFHSTMPGSYFEEIVRFERMAKKIQPHKENNATAYEVHRMRIGTPECKQLLKDLENRVEGGGEAKTLKVVVFPDQQIWASPYHFQKKGEKKEKSQHSIVAMGNPCVWAGEVVIEGNTVVCIRNASGHFRTQGDADAEMRRIKFVKAAFELQGYDTRTTEILKPDNEKRLKEFGSRITPNLTSDHLRNLAKTLSS
jgi:hypothetical protein